MSLNITPVNLAALVRLSTVMSEGWAPLAQFALHSLGERESPIA